MKAPQDLSRFTKKEINAVFKAAFSVHKDDFITILVARPSIKEHGRILLVTPRKIGNAPKRNKIRRQIKSIVREHSLYENKQDTIFIVRSLASQPNFQELAQLIKAAYGS